MLWATGGSVRVVDETVPEAITIHAAGCPSSSRKGDADEAAFISRACQFDFRVAKPWGNVDAYDVLVGMGPGFWRVQVKRATFHRPEQYQARGGGGRSRYTKESIDFLAAHVVRENLWYIVPVEAFAGRRSLHFNPQGPPRGQYERYREAWCLLACEPKARGWNDIPVLCRCKELPVRCDVCPLRR